MEEKDKIIVKWEQEDVETSNNLLNKIANKFTFKEMLSRLLTNNRKSMPRTRLIKSLSWSV